MPKTFLVGKTDGTFRTVKSTSERKAVNIFALQTHTIGDVRITEREVGAFWSFYRIATNGSIRKLPGQVPKGQPITTVKKRAH